MRKLFKFLTVMSVGLVVFGMYMFKQQSSSWENFGSYLKASVAHRVLAIDTNSNTIQIDSSFNNYLNRPNGTNPFVDIVRSRMSSNGVVILAYFDYPFLDSALNFYETSLKPFGLTNFVFAVSDSKCCEAMAHLGENSCFVYQKDAASGVASSYGNADFKRKMNIRTDMILDCLNAGITVLHSDIDVYFTKNPFDFINCQTCDIAALMDSSDYNAGFLYIRPTLNSRSVYERMKKIAVASPHIDDQKQLATAVKEARKKKDFSIIKLSTAQFQCGLYYYENGRRNFANDNPCTDCVVVHNNWIVSMEAKEYRCKETGMWNYDGKHRYYSCPERKYLTYNNPLNFVNFKVTRDEEHAAFVAALSIASILNRTLILPQFHSNVESIRCSLLNYYRIAAFDKHFGGKYRESVFLRHPLVSNEVLQSQSPVYFVASNRASSLMPKLKQGADDIVTQLTPKNADYGATSEEILDWFGAEPSSVLRFHSLYAAFFKFSNVEQQKAFDDKIKSALVKAAYRQYVK